MKISYLKQSGYTEIKIEVSPMELHELEASKTGSRILEIIEEISKVKIQKQ